MDINRYCWKSMASEERLSKIDAANSDSDEPDISEVMYTFRFS